jgi:hypothetical protein
MEYLEYRNIPPDWRPSEVKYLEFTKIVGQVTDNHIYWNIVGDYEDLEKPKIRDRKDRMYVGCERKQRKQIKVLSYVWFYGLLDNNYSFYSYIFFS